MTNPDKVVDTVGEKLTLTRVVDYETGMDGVSGVQREVVTFKGIVSNPSEEQEQRLEGRLETGAITITVNSDLDIEANRDGGRDRVLRPVADPLNSGVFTVGEDETYTIEEGTTETYSRISVYGRLDIKGTLNATDEGPYITDIDRAYTVVDVTRDKHPIVGTEKTTVVCNVLDRKDLSEDADSYVDVWSDDVLTVESDEEYTVSGVESYTGVQNDGNINNDGTLITRT